MASTVSPAVSVADTVSARQPCKLPSSQASYLTQSQKLERAVSASTPILVPDTIDLQTPGEDPVREEQALAKKVRAAAEKHGVFLVKNHGIDKQLMQDLKAALRILFNMPKEEHAVLTMPPSAEVDRFLYGYTEVWGERIYSLQGRPDKPPDPCQKFSIAKGKGEDVVNNPKNLWPLPCQVEKFPGLEKLRPLFEEFHRQCTQLAIKVGKLIAIALELDSGLFDGFDGHMCSLRGLRYPKRTGPAEQLRMAPHNDIGAFTLLPADPTEALEYYENDVWQKLGYVEDTFVVHIADAISAWTNGRWPSQTHRVSRPTKEDREQLVYFVNMDADLIMRPAKAYQVEGDDVAEPKNFEEWFKDQFDPTEFLGDAAPYVKYTP